MSSWTPLWKHLPAALSLLRPYTLLGNVQVTLEYHIISLALERTSLLYFLLQRKVCGKPWGRTLRNLSSARLKIAHQTGERILPVLLACRRRLSLYVLAPSPPELAPQVLIECYRFPWARLQVGQLLRLLFVSDIRGFLRKLPVTISTPDVLSSIFFPFPSLALGLRAIFWRLYLLGIITPLN